MQTYTCTLAARMRTCLHAYIYTLAHEDRHVTRMNVHERYFPPTNLKFEFLYKKIVLSSNERSDTYTDALTPDDLFDDNFWCTEH